jgi:hypothetical protein
VVCVIEGLEEPSASGGRRCRNWVKVLPGTELVAMLDPSGAVLVTHGGIDLGRVPMGAGNLAEQLAGGKRPRCTVTSVEISGLFRRRATRVEIEIEDMVLAAEAWRLMQEVAGSLADGGAFAARHAVDGARYAGGALLDAGSATGAIATKVGSGVVSYGIVKPASLVGQGLTGVAEFAVVKPVRAVRRMIRNAFLAAVAILVLVLAIVVVWRLPVLPGFTTSAPISTGR